MGLKECTELEIDLRSNLLQIGTGRVDDFNPVVLLWEGVRKMTKLSILRVDLRNCVLTDASIEPIAAALQRMSLEELQLDLRNNKIRDEGAKQVAQLPRICRGRGRRSPACRSTSGRTSCTKATGGRRWRKRGRPWARSTRCASRTSRRRRRVSFRTKIWD